MNRTQIMFFAGMAALLIYGGMSPDTKTPGLLVSDEIQTVARDTKADFESASFSERFGVWAYDGKGYQPAGAMAQDDTGCDCTTDSDCEYKYGSQD
jgi:hypothetical protein